MNEKELANIIPKSSLPIDLGGESTYDFAASYVPVAQRPVPTEIHTTNSPAVEEDELSMSSTSASASTPEKRDGDHKKQKRRKKKKNRLSCELARTHFTPADESVVEVAL